MNIHFTKDAWMTNKHMKRRSTLAALGNKATRYYRTLLEWQKLKRLSISCASKDEEQLKLSYSAGGLAEWHSRLEGSSVVSYKVKRHLANDPEILLLDTCTR